MLLHWLMLCMDYRVYTLMHSHMVWDARKGHVRSLLPSTFGFPCYLLLCPGSWHLVLWMVKRACQDWVMLYVKIHTNKAPKNLFITLYPPRQKSRPSADIIKLLMYTHQWPTTRSYLLLGTLISLNEGTSTLQTYLCTKDILIEC